MTLERIRLELDGEHVSELMKNLKRLNNPLVAQLVAAAERQGWLDGYERGRDQARAEMADRQPNTIKVDPGKERS